MEIRNNRQSNVWKATPGKDSKDVSTASASAASSVVLNLKKKRVKVNRSKVKDVAMGLAEIAFSMGETNDPEEYAEQMTQDIMAGLHQASEKK